VNKNNQAGWRVVFGAVLLQVCLGAIYSWSLFNQPLIDKYGWIKDQVLLTYSLAIFVFAFTTMISGRLVDQFGPRKIAIVGGLLYGAGMMLASVVSSLWLMYVAYGVLAGIGVGFAYVCPLSTCVKWFPDKKGFITGITVGAFGAGSMVFKSIIVKLIHTVGVSQTFFYLGLIYMVLVIIGATMLSLPKERDEQAGTSRSFEGKNLTVRAMFKEKSFYLVWTMLLVGCMPGLLVIGLAKDIGIEMVKLDPITAAHAVGLIALFNAGGRLGWGIVSDRVGRLKVVVWMFLITILCLLYMSLFTLTLATFYLCLSGVACCFGGFLSVFPAITSEFYGVENLGANYGVIFQAYGISALVGPILKGYTQGLNQTFLVASGFAAFGLLLTLILVQLNRQTIRQGPNCIEEL
jgi:OFA family oxalate/formate antiporter-like MFS transporter